MTAILETRLGEPIDRVDGLRKVTGAAPYPSDVSFPRLAHAALVQSTIAAGTISRIDAGDAEATPEVLAVITHESRPALAKGPMTPLGPTPPLPSKTTASCTTASTWRSWWHKPVSRRPQQGAAGQDRLRGDRQPYRDQGDRRGRDRGRAGGHR
jgi:CO/xanthine dehydrogenase Mo-binding subunit